MYRNVHGFCDKENKGINIRIEFIPCGTQEGGEYAPGKIDCAYSDATYHCHRTDCPIWNGLNL